jgi:uncharacterized DUF497 family protein
MANFIISGCIIAMPVRPAAFQNKITAPACSPEAAQRNSGLYRASRISLHPGYAGYYLLHVHSFVHTIARMKIEFDPDKAASNPLNHDGVTFDEAEPVLLDPYALTREDADAQREVRFVTLGMGAKGRILIRGLDATRRQSTPDFSMEGQSATKETL